MQQFLLVHKIVGTTINASAPVGEKETVESCGQLISVRLIDIVVEQPGGCTLALNNGVELQIIDDFHDIQLQLVPRPLHFVSHPSDSAKLENAIKHHQEVAEQTEKSPFYGEEVAERKIEARVEKNDDRGLAARMESKTPHEKTQVADG